MTAKDPMDEFNTFKQIHDILTQKKTYESRWSIRKPRNISDVIAYRYYKLQSNVFWNVESFNFPDDLNDFNALPESYKKMLKKVLCFLVNSDGAIIENIMDNFIRNCDSIFEKLFYGIQTAIENVHAETYSLVAQTFFPEDIDQNEIFASMDDNPVVMRKAEWMNKYMNSKVDKQERRIGFALTEGIFFGISFALIFFLKQDGKFRHLIESNSYIIRDEGIHRDFALEYYSAEMQPLHVDTINAMTNEAVEIEISYIKWITEDNDIPDLKTEDLMDYVKVLANNILQKLELPDLYPNVVNKLAFMEEISLSTKSNFYEHTPTEYNRFSLERSLDWNRKTEKSVEEIRNYADHDF